MSNIKKECRTCENFIYLRVSGGNDQGALISDLGCCEARYGSYRPEYLCDSYKQSKCSRCENLERFKISEYTLMYYPMVGTCKIDKEEKSNSDVICDHFKDCLLEYD